MDREIVIIGSGGHAGVVAATALSSGFQIKGYVSPLKSEANWASGLVWLASDDLFFNQSDLPKNLLNGIGSTRDMTLRRNIYNRYISNNFTFGQLKHSSAIISDNVSLGSGTQIMAGAILQSSVSIGENSIINSGAIIEHDSLISSHVHIAPGVTISGEVMVGENCHVGTGATIIQGIKIGKNVTIAAGSVVVKNVRDGMSVKGVPAKPFLLSEVSVHK